MSSGPTVSSFLIQSYRWIWFTTWALDPQFQAFLSNPFPECSFPLWALDPQFQVFLSKPIPECAFSCEPWTYSFKLSYPILPLWVCFSHLSPGPTVSSFLIQSYLWVCFSHVSPGPTVSSFLIQSYLWVCFPTRALDPWFKFSFSILPLSVLFPREPWFPVFLSNPCSESALANWVLDTFGPNMSQSLLLTQGPRTLEAFFFKVLSCVVLSLLFVQSCAYLC
jgi:hypothetical protein